LDNKDTVPIWVALAIFGVIGILIVGAFGFAGWSIIQLRNNASNAVLAVGKNVVVAAAPEEEEEFFEEDDFEYEEEYVYAHYEPEEFIPAPVQAPAQTPAPTRRPQTTPRRTPEPTPTPAPPIACHVCNATGVITCASCNGIGGGRGTIPFEISPVSDVWWCTTCSGSGTISCRTCSGSGWVN
jgi:hypothetical protein